MTTTTTTKKWCEGVMQQQEEETKSVDNIILNFFLKKKYKNIYTLVDKLQYIDGNLQLDDDDNNIKVSLFWLAVLMNDVSLMSLLLKRGNCNVNTLGTYKSRNFFKATPLYVACALGYKFMDAIVILLKNKADVNITDKYGYTPLIKTICSTKPLEAITIANYLLLYNADINHTDIDGNTVLHYSIAYSNGLYNLYARYLIRRGADPINIKSKTFSNLNAGMLYIIPLAQHFNDDDDDVDDDFKIMCLMSFIDKILVKSKYSTLKDVETMYRICGAAFNSSSSSSSDKFNVMKKYFWKKALEYRKDEEKEEEEEEGGRYYKHFSNIIGKDKYEFRTIQDVELINSKIDNLIQSIFISLRILGPTHGLTRNLLEQLLEEEDSSSSNLRILLWKFIKNLPE